MAPTQSLPSTASKSKGMRCTGEPSEAWPECGPEPVASVPAATSRNVTTRVSQLSAFALGATSRGRSGASCTRCQVRVVVVRSAIAIRKWKATT